MATATERYEAAAHAIQSGVAMEHERVSTDGTPKHLRTGINLRAVDQAGLVTLLIRKGIITEAEYVEAIADAAEVEQRRYEQRLSDLLHADVTLG